jgi:hypothetical protein
MKGIRRILDVEKTLKKLMENKDYFTSDNMSNMIMNVAANFYQVRRRF